MSKKKTDLPVYTITTFQQHSGSLHFDMGTMQENAKRYSFASTPHRHDCYFIMFVTHGGGKHIIDSVAYDIKPFAVYLMHPGQIHSWEFSDDIRGYYMYFTLEFYKSYPRERHLAKFPYIRMLAMEDYLQLDNQTEAPLVVMLEDMYTEFKQRKVGWEDVLRNSLDTLLIRMSRYNTVETAIKGSLSTTMQVRTLYLLIEKHFIESKLPSDYAEKMNVSPKHLNALCKRSLNKTVTDLIQERTILEAKRHLAYTEKSIKEIAVELGFNDLSYFMRFFKKLTKMTPDQFRKSVEHVDSVEVVGTI